MYSNISAGATRFRLCGDWTGRNLWYMTVTGLVTDPEQETSENWSSSAFKVLPSQGGFSCPLQPGCLFCSADTTVGNALGGCLGTPCSSQMWPRIWGALHDKRVACHIHKVQQLGTNSKVVHCCSTMTKIIQLADWKKGTSRYAALKLS